MQTWFEEMKEALWADFARRISSEEEKIKNRVERATLSATTALSTICPCLTAMSCVMLSVPQVPRRRLLPRPLRCPAVRRHLRLRQQLLAEGKAMDAPPCLGPSPASPGRLSRRPTPTTRAASSPPHTRPPEHTTSLLLGAK
jgi:hypothetical protein